MINKFVVRTVLVLLGSVGALIAWYVVAADYDYGALAGTYVFHEGDETCTLRLNADHTFSEQLMRGKQVETATGEWRRFGEARMALSSSFLKVSRQELGPSGENYGQFYKTFGVIPYLQLDPDPGGPVLRRKWVAR